MKYFIAGPTGSGKTELSIKLAKQLNIPIVNVDSRQMWKNMQSITCSPNSFQKSQAKHLLFNYLDENIKPNLGSWAKELQKINTDYVMVGGTTFYAFNLIRGIPMEKFSNTLKTDDWNILNQMNSQIASRIHYNDKYRINRAINFLHNNKCDYDQYDDKYMEKLFVIILEPNQTFLTQNIRNRIDTNIQDWIEEIQNNQHENYRSIIGYNECLSYINKEINLLTLKEQIYNATLRYIKKQKKFLKKLTPNIQIQYHNYNSWKKATNDIVQKLICKTFKE